MQRRFAGIAVSMVVAACSFTPQAVSIPGDTRADNRAAGADFQRRAETRTDGAVQVSTAVLSVEESQAVYGVPLAAQSMQPVWVEVRNRDDRPYYLLSPGLDPDFFPASEAAEVFAKQASEADKPALDRRFSELAFRNPVMPGTTQSGFVLTHLDEGFKFVQIDLVASGRAKAFSILAVVPGLRADYHSSEVFLGRVALPQILNYEDAAAFRAALEALPCCVTNADGSKNGDPLNLVIVGGLEDAFPAFARRGWRATEEKWFGSIAKMVKSALAGERYSYAPVSNLYLFGRAQDIALQKARDNIHQRNHLRLWLSPIRFRGKQVWVGQISRDIGSRLTIHSPTLTTHRIDPDVDEARAALTQDMAYSQSLTMVGFVKGVGEAPSSAPRANLTTDPYYTDGLRTVLVFDHRPRSMDSIGFLPWEVTGDRPEPASLTDTR